MKTSNFNDFYEENIYPILLDIKEGTEEIKKYSKKSTMIYLKLFGLTIPIMLLSQFFRGPFFGILLFCSAILMGLSVAFGILQLTLNIFVLLKSKKSYENEYYKQILPSILYKFDPNFRRNNKITFPENLYQKLHIERGYKKYTSSACIVGKIDNCKTHIAKIRTKGGFLNLRRTQCIILKVKLRKKLTEKTFLISSRHHKSTNRNLPKKDTIIDSDFAKKFCIYSKKVSKEQTILTDDNIVQNLIELHDLLEGNISTYIVNSNLYFKFNLGVNVQDKTFLKIANSNYFLKYFNALKTIKELVININTL